MTMPKTMPVQNLLRYISFQTFAHIHRQQTSSSSHNMYSILTMYLSMYTHISFASGVTQECLKENQFISCALLERKYVLEPVQYVNCTTLLADQKRV